MKRIFSVQLIVAALIIAAVWAHSMPTEIDVNGVNWDIKRADYVTSSEGAVVGNTSCATRTITIANRTYDNSPQTVLMHELTHALVCTGTFDVDNLYWNSTDNDKHEGVYHIAFMWSELLRRNRHLALYLGMPRS